MTSSINSSKSSKENPFSPDFCRKFLESERALENNHPSLFRFPGRRAAAYLDVIDKIMKIPDSQIRYSEKLDLAAPFYERAINQKIWSEGEKQKALTILRRFGVS